LARAGVSLVLRSMAMFSRLEERLRDAIDISVEWGQIDLRFSESLLAKDQCEFISVNMNSQQNKHTTSKPLPWRLTCFNKNTFKYNNFFIWGWRCWRHMLAFVRIWIH
jgi:hypothetical protein